MIGYEALASGLETAQGDKVSRTSTDEILWTKERTIGIRELRKSAIEAIALRAGIKIHCRTLIMKGQRIVITKPTAHS